MKLVFVNIILMMVTLSTIVYAKQSELTIVGMLKPKENKISKIKVESGQTTFSVFSTDEKALFSCKYLDGAGNVGLEQKFVSKCVGKVNLSQKGFVSLVVVNEANKLIDYKILVESK